MLSSTVYHKTAQCLEAMASRQSGLLPRQRSLLIMVDGKRTHAELVAIAAALGAAEGAIAELVAGGWIASAGGLASLAPAAVVGAAPVVAEHVKGESVSFTVAKRHAVALLHEVLGVALAASPASHIEAAQSIGEYVAAARRARDAIREARGSTAAQKYLQDLEGWPPEAP
jgi:hypothetical protein